MASHPVMLYFLLKGGQILTLSLLPTLLFIHLFINSFTHHL